MGIGNDSFLKKLQKLIQKYSTGYYFMSKQSLNGWKRIDDYDAGYQDGLADFSAALWSVFAWITLSLMLFLSFEINAE